MKSVTSGSGSRESSPPRHNDVAVQCAASSAETRDLVERGRTRNMVSKFEAGSKVVNVCGPGSRTLANSNVDNLKKVNAVRMPMFGSRYSV